LIVINPPDIIHDSKGLAQKKIEQGTTRAQMIRLTLVLMMLTILASCEAPHRNPLDPKNPDYSYGRIAGLVQTVSLPVEAVPKTIVYWSPANQQSQTDAQGRFELLTPAPIDGWLILTHPEFGPDSVYVHWSAEKMIDLNIYLNALPQLDSLAVYSIVLNRFPSLQKEQLVVEAQISDRDNDIDSVKTSFPDQAMEFYLPYNTTTKSYLREFSILDLVVPRLEEMVGQKLLVTVTDVFSHTNQVGQGQLIRVIHEEVLTVSPESDTITGPHPTLIWQPFSVDFQFSYTIEIYTNEVAPQLIWDQMGLDHYQSSCSVDTDLPDGNYFWVIWAIDTFGNRTRSKPAAFQVKKGS